MRNICVLVTIYVYNVFNICILNIFLKKYVNFVKIELYYKHWKTFMDFYKYY